MEKKQVLNKVDSLRQELERAAPNRWRLDTVLGEGGYGVVVSAQNMKAPGRPLRAIKVILAAGGAAGARFTDREFKQMTREGEITQSLAHENVCRTFQVSPDPCLSFLCINNDCSWSCQYVVDIAGLFAHAAVWMQPNPRLVLHGHGIFGRRASRHAASPWKVASWAGGTMHHDNHAADSDDSALFNHAKTKQNSPSAE